MEIKEVKMIESQDWDALVVKTYERPYCFQQQYGCQHRGIVTIKIPSAHTNEENMHDYIPEVIKRTLYSYSC